MANEFEIESVLFEASQLDQGMQSDVSDELSDRFSGAQDPYSRECSVSLTEDDLALDRSLRPSRLVDYLGQTKVKESLSILIEAARARHDVVDHILFSGPPTFSRSLGPPPAPYRCP